MKTTHFLLAIAMLFSASSAWSLACDPQMDQDCRDTDVPVAKAELKMPCGRTAQVDRFDQSGSFRTQGRAGESTTTTRSTRKIQ